MHKFKGLKFPVPYHKEVVLLANINTHPTLGELDKAMERGNLVKPKKNKPAHSLKEKISKNLWLAADDSGKQQQRMKTCSQH